MCRHGAEIPDEMLEDSWGLSLHNTKEVLQPRRSAAARILRQMRHLRQMRQVEFASDAPFEVASEAPFEVVSEAPFDVTKYVGSTMYACRG